MTFLISALAIVVLVFWFKTPWANLLAWTAALSVQYELGPDFRLALSDLFVPSLALSLLIWRKKAEKKEPRQRSSLPTLILVFAVVFVVLGDLMALLNLHSIPQWTWLNKDIGLLDLMVCFFAIVHLVNTREKLQAIVRALVLSATALNVLALAGGVARYFLGIPNMMMYSETSMRLVGFMVNPSAYGGFLICVLFIQLSLLLDGSPMLPLPRWLQYMNAGLLGVACLMTLSRSAFLGLAAGFVILMGFYRVKAAIWFSSFVLVAVLTIGAAAVYWGNFAREMAADFETLAFSETTMYTRMNIDKAAMSLLSKDPTNAVTGVGVGTFLARAQEMVGYPYIIHDEFVWLLVETGILGLGLFLGIAWRSLRNCVRVWRGRASDSSIAVGLACGLVGTLAWMMATEGLWHRHVWLLFGLSEVCCRLQVQPRHFVNRPCNACRLVNLNVRDSRILAIENNCRTSH